MKPLKHLRTVLLFVPLLSLSACRSPYYADQGAALGGVAGGLTGAALGDKRGNALGGAVLGNGGRCARGHAIGDSMDAEVERRQALIEAKTGRRMAGLVTTTDVTTMVTSGLSDDVVINHIRANGVAAPLTPGDIIEMHDLGVSEKVINAMQQTSARQVMPPPVTYAAPVIVEDPYVVAPYWHPRPFWPGPGPYHRPHRRPGMTWGFSYPTEPPIVELDAELADQRLELLCHTSQFAGGGLRVAGTDSRLTCRFIHTGDALRDALSRRR